MAKPKDAFDPELSDVAPIGSEQLLFCDFRTVAGDGKPLAEVPPFDEAYRRYEFHPLVSASLWLVEQFQGQKRRRG